MILAYSMRISLSALSPVAQFLQSSGNHFCCYASLQAFLKNDKTLQYEGLARKLKQFSSLAILHLMMDVMPVMTEPFYRK